MKVFSTSVKEKLAQLDYIILICALGMTMMSVLTLYGIRDQYVGGSRMFLIQTLSAVLGFACVIAMSLFDYDAIVTRLWIPIAFLSISLLMLVKLIGTNPTNDPSQPQLWINLGVIYWQPSETVKMLFILSLAKHIDLVKSKVNHPKSLLAVGIHAVIIIGMVIFIDDLGSALVFMCIFAAMFYSAGLSLWYYVGAVGTAVIAMPYIWPHLGYYQQMRILCGFDPTIDPEYFGYQQLRSRAAISAGGFWGSGINGGTEYLKVPVATTDCFFAITAEKFGMFGALVYMLFMTVLIIRVIRIARTSRKDTGTFICVGVVAIMIAQTTENIGMCLAMLPVVGITLPFMSYGGSSMLSTWLLLGLVESVKLHNTKYYFEREKA